MRDSVNILLQLLRHTTATSIAFILTIVIVGLAFVIPSNAQNSTKKIRVQPNKSAIRIGTAIKWETDYTTALARAKAESKPIFWYVPRLAETFMDRKKEVDRYMKAGPFSWPEMIERVNQDFIPLMQIPATEQAKKFELAPFKFVEPGILVIEPNEEEVARMDRITTFHRGALTAWAGANKHGDPNMQSVGGKVLSHARTLFSKRSYDDVLNIRKISTDMPKVKEKNTLAELGMLEAMSLFRLNRHEEAKAKFSEVASNYPESPIGWKCAAEAQGFGPFVRGFEVDRSLAVSRNGNQISGAMQKGINIGSAAPAGTYTEPQLFSRGIEYLLGMQHEDGGFRDSDYDFGGTDGLPNVHVAVTSIVGLSFLNALLDETLEFDRPRTEAALEKVIKFVMDEKNLNTNDSDELIWAYLYRQRLVNALLKNERVAIPMASKTLKSLEAMQTKSGAWYHEYNNPFVTASCLWAMNEAKSLGVEVDASKVEAGVASLQRDRYKTGAYSYSTSRRPVSKKDASDRATIGSAGRMPLCEGALFAWERSDEAALLNSLEVSFEKHDTMASALKYDDHTSAYSYGGFFFWYDMQGRCDAIGKVADADVRSKLAKRQREIVMALPEIDGCFVDSHEIGRCYGTAMALICLTECERAMKSDK